jgi:hypothetical protein
MTEIRFGYLSAQLRKWAANLKRAQLYAVAVAKLGRCLVRPLMPAMEPPFPPRGR